MFSVIPEYFSWHYGRGLCDLTQNCKNLISFIYHFFSIPLLLKTLFVPWRRMAEGYQKSFNPESFFETFIINSLMRFVGALFRLVFIVAGLFFLLLGCMLSSIFFVFWLIMPLLVVVFFIKGLTLL